MWALPGPPPTATVKPPNPRAVNESSDCTQWFQADEGDTCEAFLGSFGLKFDQFFAMNPSIKSDCTGMAQGTYYCISTPTIPDGDDYPITTSAPSTPTTSRPSMATTPSPVQSGMVGGCDRFYDVQPGDGCWAIANQYGIALDDFYAWNPAVGTDCHDLEAGVYVCVGTTAAGAPKPTTATTASPTKTTGGGGVVTPTPTQSGMVRGCGKFYRVQAGDGCWAIANEYGITTDDLYRWNPGLDGCNSLWPDYYVCVMLSDSD
ncbi:carbohydrate-binding module family 50 protein [Apiospora sp. TS-2023a]